MTYTPEERETVVKAVRSKLNITWDSPASDFRLLQVVDVVSPALASRLGMEASHGFLPGDGEAWGLFLNACLYEFSDALDDFWANYAAEIRAARLLRVAGDGDA